MDKILSVLPFLGGTIFGFFANRLLEIGEEKVKSRLKDKAIKKEIEKARVTSEGELNIVHLANGCPLFKEQYMDIKTLDKSLYIGFPEDMVSELQEGKLSGFHKTCSFNGRSDFADIVKETGIVNLVELIEKHKRIVARQFINEENGCYFNGEKYGVFEINGFKRTEDKEEDPLLKMKLYNTDYFTHKIFKSIYKEIKDTDPIGKTNLGSLAKYRSFATSFGINGIVRLKSGQSSDSVILTRRSAFATDTNGEELYSVSVIEGLTKTDDTYNAEVNLYQCFKRGMTEELGIREDMYSDQDIKFYDVFLELNKFEIGISCCVQLDDQYIFETDIKDLIAKDNTLEIAEKFAYPFNKKDINKIIVDKKFNKQSIFTLKSVLMRKKSI